MNAWIHSAVLASTLACLAAHSAPAGEPRSEPTPTAREAPEPEPFYMKSFAWSHRPLLVFAPRADDARLERQLAEIARERRGFEDRDMVEIVVTGDGPSRAGEDQLTKRDAASLRDRHDVASSAFAVLLVGKDGGVKRRASDPVTMRTIFAQVDSMPMRRAEMRGD